MQGDNEDFGGSDNEIPENDVAHNKLITSISKISGALRNHFPQRSEPGKQVSEFNLRGTDDRVKLHDLIGGLKAKPSNAAIKKQVRWALKKKKVLPKPLEKSQAQKIQRVVSYHKVSEEVADWDSVVERNRAADQSIFPLQKPDVQLKTANQFLSKFVPRTPLEEEIAKVLHGSKSIVKKGQELSQAEKEAMSAMSLKEAMQRRKELAKLRILQSYEAAKSKRQNKIKSKKYHRILRQEKIKKQLKDFEELQKNDPEAALKKLEELEKARIQERSTLKHRNTSKWSKMQAARAKYNRESRQKLSQELMYSRELTQKAKPHESSDDENDVEMKATPASTDDNNPWMQVSKNMPADVAFSGYRKYWEQQAKQNHDQNGIINSNKCESDLKVNAAKAKGAGNLENTIAQENGTERQENEERQEKTEKKKMKKKVQSLDEIDRMFNKADQNLEGKIKHKLGKLKLHMKHSNAISNSKSLKKRKHDGKKEIPIKHKKMHSVKKIATQSEKWQVQDMNEQRHLDESLDRLQTMEDIETRMEADTFSGHSTNDKLSLEVSKEISKPEVMSAPAKTPQIDPKNILAVQSKPLQSDIPDVILEGDEDDSDEEVEEEGKSQRMTIEEAFADDDVVAEFRDEKKELVNSLKGKDIDLSLPGWGEWGGKGLKVSKRKRRRFIIKAPPLPVRKDAEKGHVILNEKKDPQFRKHLVSEVPFPFTSVEDFEKSIRAPIGNTWVPETAYRKMVAPKLITKMGTVIKPIDRSVLAKAPKSKQQGKK